MSLRLGIVILTYERWELLEALLHSIENQSQKKIDWQAHVFVNRKSCPEELPEKSRQHPRISFYFSHQSHNLGMARNLCLLEADVARYDGILFLDDDCWLPPNYFEMLYENISQQRGDILGGPNLTPAVSKERAFEKTLGRVLESPWFVGPFYKRFVVSPSGVSQSNSAFMLCNLYVSKAVLKKLHFSNEMSSGEENEFLTRARAEGFSTYYAGDLYVEHFRRPNLKSLCRQSFRYGIGRGEQILAGSALGVLPGAFLWLGVFSVAFGLFFISEIFALALLAGMFLYALLTSLLTPKGWGIVPGLQFGYLAGVLWAPVHVFKRVKLKELLRILAAKIVPQKMATLIYKINFEIFKRRCQRRLGAEIWCRNSLQSGRIRFALSDIDVTILGERPLDRALKDQLRGLLKRSGFVGEVMYYSPTALEDSARFINPYELFRDPILRKNLGDEIYSFRDSFAALVFLLRMIESNLASFKNESFLSEQKWRDHFRLLGLEVGEVSLHGILWAMESQMNLAIDWRSLEKFFYYRLAGLKKKHIAKKISPNFLIAFFPHHTEFLSDASVPKELKSIAKLQVHWEIWGISHFGTLEHDYWIKTLIETLIPFYKRELADGSKDDARKSDASAMRIFARLLESDLNEKSVR